MHYSVVSGIVLLVSVTALVCIVVVWRHSVTLTVSSPPVLVNVSLLKAVTEIESVSAGTIIPLEFSTNYDVSTALYLNSTIERYQISQMSGTLMQRNKIKEVMILSSES
jgi:hypothetical protein